MSTTTDALNDQIRAAAQAASQAYGNTMPYALIGGAACVLLGGTRITRDIDFVVPRGTNTSYRRALGSSGTFTVNPRTHFTTYGTTRIEVDIVSPPGMYKGGFDANTPTLNVGGVRVLHPLLLLDAKCAAYWERSDAKRATDAMDIIFLL